MKNIDIVTYLKNAAIEFENRAELIAFAYGYIFGCIHNAPNKAAERAIWDAYGKFLEYVDATPRFNVVE